MPFKNTPDAEQTAQFAAFMQFWQSELSLGDWRIEPGGKQAKNAMASVEVNPPARLAVYRLGDFGGEAITPASLKKTALHESLHLLLHDLIETAQDRGATADQLEAAEHCVINVLERVLSKE